MQIQQVSTATAAGFLSVISSLSSVLLAAGTGGAFFNPAGGGFFALLATLELLVRLRFDDDDDDDVCDCRFLEGAEAANGSAIVSVDLSTVLLCERFLDLVVGPVTALLLMLLSSTAWAAPLRPNEYGLFVVVPAEAEAEVEIDADAAPAWVLPAIVLVLRA